MRRRLESSEYGPGVGSCLATTLGDFREFVLGSCNEIALGVFKASPPAQSDGGGDTVVALASNPTLQRADSVAWRPDQDPVHPMFQAGTLQHRFRQQALTIAAREGVVADRVVPLMVVMHGDDKGIFTWSGAGSAGFNITLSNWSDDVRGLADATTTLAVVDRAGVGTGAAFQRVVSAAVFDQFVECSARIVHVADAPVALGVAGGVHLHDTSSPSPRHGAVRAGLPARDRGHAGHPVVPQDQATPAPAPRRMRR